MRVVGLSQWTLSARLVDGALDFTLGDGRRLAWCARRSTIRVCDETAFPVWMAIARCMRGRLFCDQGSFDVGLSEVRVGYALWLSTGSMVSRPLYLSLQTERLMLAGEFETAQAYPNAGLASIERFGERRLGPTYGACMPRLRCSAARWRTPMRRCAGPMHSRSGSTDWALHCAAPPPWRLWAADGRRARAQRLLEPLVASWSEGRATRGVQAALALCESFRDAATRGVDP
jgi:hypothetical protein